jgi:hypothetical protein
MPRKQSYVVHLTEDERRQCRELVRRGQAPARSIMHAQVLLKAEAGPEGPGWSDAAVAQAFGVSAATVGALRKTFAREGLPAALHHYRIVNRKYPHKLDGHGEAHLIALACSPPPEGHVRWTLRLLAHRMVELGYVDHLCHVTVGEVLKKTNCSLGGPCASASRPDKAPSS